MAGYIELVIDQGTDFRNIINLTSDVTGNVTNIAGYIVRSKMRRSYYSVNASETIVCTVTDAANGEITMTMASSNTENLRPGRYVFDVEMVDISNNVSRILGGIIHITPESTR